MPHFTFHQFARLFYQRAYSYDGVKNLVKQLHDEQPLLDEDSRNRLWDHGKHAESIFINQLSFFLIFESLLLSSVIGTILSNQHSYGRIVLVGITLFGCLVTLFWLCIQYNQGHLFEKLKTRMAEQLPEYNETLRQRREGVGMPYKFIQFMSNLSFQAISIPGLVALAWFCLLLYLLILG
jgi:hypothetical protein